MKGFPNFLICNSTGSRKNFFLDKSLKMDVKKKITCTAEKINKWNKERRRRRSEEEEKEKEKRSLLSSCLIRLSLFKWAKSINKMDYRKLLNPGCENGVHFLRLICYSFHSIHSMWCLQYANHCFKHCICSNKEKIRRKSLSSDSMYPSGRDK